MEPVHNHLGGEGVDRLVAFIVERHTIQQRRAAGQAWPWTDDPILQQYRFCNVHREDDAVTKWIAGNWREPYAAYQDLWHLMALARLFNEPETLLVYESLNNVMPFWNVGALRGAAAWQRACKRRVFNPAYMITTAGKKQDKIEYICDLLDNLWTRRHQIRPVKGDTLNSFHMTLGMFDGLGSFLAGQVVADMRHVSPLSKASDLQSFACSGPGSRRGLNRVMGRPIKTTWTEDEWRRYAAKLQVYVNTALRRHKMQLHGQDLQNCLCEFDKMERTRLGEGKPKQLYRRPK